MNLFYDFLPVEIQEVILQTKTKLELKDLQKDLKNSFSNADVIIYERNRTIAATADAMVIDDTFDFRKISAIDRLGLKKANKYNDSVVPILYRIKTKWKRFYGDTLYKNLRNPWNYSWVTDLNLLTNIELQIHCRNNNLSPIGNKEILIQRLMSI